MKLKQLLNIQSMDLNPGPINIESIKYPLRGKNIIKTCLIFILPGCSRKIVENH